MSAGCAEPCPLETGGTETYDSPFVENEEWVCRTIRPGEYKTKSQLKFAFVQTSQLSQASLSAWRLDEIDELPILAAKLKDKMGQEPSNMLAVPAFLLRGVKIDDQRALCVINDTRIDREGGMDAEHIAIAPCQRFDEHPDREAVISALKGEIISVFRGEGTPLHEVPD